jgi:hypothetical protein
MCYNLVQSGKSDQGELVNHEATSHSEAREIIVLKNSDQRKPMASESFQNYSRNFAVKAIQGRKVYEKIRKYDQKE